MAFVYVVTIYGCDSGVNRMWTPFSKVFYDKKSAIVYYKKCEKDLGNENVKYYKGKTSISALQDSYEHKRPEGVVLSFVKIEGIDEKKNIQNIQNIQNMDDDEKENEKTDKDENNAE